MVRLTGADLRDIRHDVDSLSVVGLTGADLRDIQREVDSLSDRTSPDEVCTFLSLRRDVMFLEFDAAVRHAMTDMFLSTNNLPAYQVLLSHWPQSSVGIRLAL